MADTKKVYIEKTVKFIDITDIPDQDFEPSFITDLSNGIHRYTVQAGYSQYDDWFIAQGIKNGETIYIEIDY